MTRRLVTILGAVAATLLVGGALLAQEAPRLTGPTPFPRESPAPPIPRAVTDDMRVGRNYPEQPPVIPHAIDGYELSLNANRCMTCHARRFTQQSQAPMISVTHYQDREGNTLGGLAPRRYVCTACHVPQSAVSPLVPNRFVDMDEIAEPPAQPARNPRR